MWDQRNPHSLLGCQIVDSCPLEFTPHPALVGVRVRVRARVGVRVRVSST
jgi:hypothetical protein